MCVGMLMVSILNKRFIISQGELAGWLSERCHLQISKSPSLKFERPGAWASQGPRVGTPVSEQRC